jgi:hypothetical protein
VVPPAIGGALLDDAVERPTKKITMRTMTAPRLIMAVRRPFFRGEDRTVTSGLPIAVITSCRKLLSSLRIRSRRARSVRISVMSPGALRNRAKVSASYRSVNRASIRSCNASSSKLIAVVPTCRRRTRYADSIDTTLSASSSFVTVLSPASYSVGVSRLGMT